MNAPEFLEIARGYARLQFDGKFSLEQHVAQASQAIAFCREQHIKRILMIWIGEISYPPPTLWERYFMCEAWAEASQWIVALAIVAPLEYIDPEKFGVLVAGNVGCTADVFSSEPEALKWLLAQN